MLTLILVDVQYVQNVAFSYDKGSNGQKHSLSDSHRPTKRSVVFHHTKVFHEKSLE